MFDKSANAESCQEYMSVSVCVCGVSEWGWGEGVEQGYPNTLHLETHDPALAA